MDETIFDLLDVLGQLLVHRSDRHGLFVSVLLDPLILLHSEAKLLAVVVAPAVEHPVHKTDRSCMVCSQRDRRHPSVVSVVLSWELLYLVNVLGVTRLADPALVVLIRL